MLPETYKKNTIDREERLAVLRADLLKRSRSFVASLLVLDGTAELTDPMTPRPRPAEGGIRLAKGTRLTVKSGRALVRFEDGSDLWLESGAILDLSPWSEKVRTLRLLAGRAVAIVAREAKRPFQVLTPHGEVLVTGTAFGIDIGRELLSVPIFHGSVQVTSEHGTVEGRRGQRLLSARGKTPWQQPLEQAIKDQFSWLGSIAATAMNRAVAKPFGALAKELNLPRGASTTRRWGKALRPPTSLLIALTIVGGGVAAWLLVPASFGDKPEQVANPSPAALAAPASTSSAPTASANAAVSPLPSVVQSPKANQPFPPLAGQHTTAPTVADVPSGSTSMRVKVIGIDGALQEIELDGGQDLGKLLNKLPKAKVDEIRGLIQSSPGNNETLDLFTWNDGEGVLALPPLQSFDSSSEYRFIFEGADTLPAEARVKIVQEVTENIRLNSEEVAGRLKEIEEQRIIIKQLGDEFTTEDFVRDEATLQAIEEFKKALEEEAAPKEK